MYSSVLSNTFRRMKIKTCIHILTLISCVIILVTVRYTLTGYKKIDVKKANFLRKEIPIPTKSKVERCSDVIHSQRDANSKLVEDLLSLVQPVFEKKFKNPCFYDKCHQNGTGTSRRLRCLPFFHILGVDKCGSTDLYNRLVSHPQIIPNSGVLDKEPSWWSWRRYGHRLLTDTHKKESFVDYLRYFDRLSGQLERSSVDLKSITVDGTPMDFWDFTGWPKIPQNVNAREPKILTPHLMKHMNPNVKFILIFRQPSERLFSDYIFLNLGKPTAQAFHDNVLKSMKMFADCCKTSTEKACLFSRELQIKMPTRLHLGVYSVFLEEWWKVFDVNSFLMLRTEDYSKNIKNTLRTVFAFLEVDDLSETMLETISKKKRVHKTKRKKGIGRMFPETKRLLDDFYAPYVRRFHVLTNDTRFLW